MPIPLTCTRNQIRHTPPSPPRFPEQAGSEQMELLPLNPFLRVLGQSLEEQFDAFHAANPHVYAALRTLAVSLKRRGAKKAGIGQLFEMLRWQYALQTQGNDYRLNNNYSSFYARLLNEDPDLRGMFETRTLRWQRHRR